jgi:osmotically-inducible protein OsmY
MATTTQATTDDSVREDVLSELKWDPRISSENDIAVAVKDKVVTLSGFVPTFWDKDAAERAAKRVYGVKAVASDISVKPLWQRSDPEIARDAIQQFERHISIPDDKIKVTVKNGWVTLEGTVDRELQKKLAHSAVKKLKGVAGITNNITIKPKITPEEVKDKIEDALRRSAELDARRIRVEVKHGTVTLHGSVRSWAEREEAERAAWSSPGTTVVKNEIVVEP